MIFNSKNFVLNVLNTEGAKEPKRARMSPPKPLFSDFKVYQVQAVAQKKRRESLPKRLVLFSDAGHLISSLGLEIRNYLSGSLRKSCFQGKRVELGRDLP